ncbi:MAG TPA: hypothetical protein VFD70_09035, partial [Anaerolineae bacterium]|nr:hypothetical protein [Anaerolineae bacterium]
MMQVVSAELLKADTQHDTARGMASVLALLHPDGFVNRSCIIGAACPVSLAPPVASTGQYDLMVFAPTQAEWETNGWLNTATDFI